MTGPTTLARRATALLELHQPGNPVILPTVWDAWSARLATDAGFAAFPLRRNEIALYAENRYEIGGRLFLSAGLRGELFRTASVPADGFSRPFFPRLVSMTDGTGTTQYSYVAVGTPGALQLAQESSPLSSSAITYAYDALGRLSQRTVRHVARG